LRCLQSTVKDSELICGRIVIGAPWTQVYGLLVSSSTLRRWTVSVVSPLRYWRISSTRLRRALVRCCRRRTSAVQFSSLCLLAAGYHRRVFAVRSCAAVDGGRPPSSSRHCVCSRLTIVVGRGTRHLVLAVTVGRRPALPSGRCVGLRRYASALNYAAPQERGEW